MGPTARSLSLWAAVWAVIGPLRWCDARAPKPEKKVRSFDDLVAELSTTMPKAIVAGEVSGTDSAAWLTAELEARSKSMPAADREWHGYQARILAICDKFWMGGPRDMPLREFTYELFQMWQREMPMIGRFVFVPLPWHTLIEVLVRRQLKCELLVEVMDLLASLDESRFDHFMAPGQATPLEGFDRCNITTFPDLFREKIVFQFDSLLISTLFFKDKQSGVSTADDSRYGEARYGAAGRRLAVKFKEISDIDWPPSIPIPLLHSSDRVLAFKAKKKKRAFFAGDCSNHIRPYLASTLAHSSVYDMSKVHPCVGGPQARLSDADERNYLSFQDFVTQVSTSLWILAPAGTYPAVFTLYEVIQAGSLPVYICPAGFDAQRVLPYGDLGLNWDQDLGMLWETHTNISHSLATLPKALDRRSVDHRRIIALWTRHLFTVEGVYGYVKLVLSVLAEKSTRT